MFHKFLLKARIQNNWYPLVTKSFRLRPLISKSPTYFYLSFCIEHQFNCSRLSFCRVLELILISVSSHYYFCHFSSLTEPLLSHKYPDNIPIPLITVLFLIVIFASGGIKDRKSLNNGSTENNNFTADMLGGAASRFPNSALFSSINANVTNVTQKVYSNLDKLRKKTDNPGTKK